MRKEWLFLLLLLLGAGGAWATEPDNDTAPDEKKAVVERRVREITLQEAVFRKIRAESKKSPDQDLSQLLKESDENDTTEIDDTKPRDYDAEVNKIFESLY